MANALITSQVVTNDVLRIAHNASAFLGNMNTEFKEAWTGEYKPGNTLNARRPVQFTHRTGSAANVQDVTESSTPIVIQPELGVDFAISSNDLALSVGSNGQVSKEFKNRYLLPAGLKIAAILDFSIGTIIKNGAHQLVGTPGTPPATFADLLNSAVPLDRMSVPRDGNRMAAIEPGANANIVAGISSLFNNQSVLGEQYKTGIIKTSAGLDIAMSQNVPSHTVGPLGGAPLTNGANQGLTNAGATDNPLALNMSLITNGWTAAVAVRLNQGDTFTIAGIFSVNPETKASTGVLQSFVVIGPTAAAPGPVSSDVAGNLTMAISPCIIAGGAYQNVTARPGTGVALTITSGVANTTYTQNIVWHRNAITFVSPKQETPGGMDMAYQASLADEGGISLRFVRGFDINLNRFVSRFDVLWGAAVVLPNFSVRRTN